jgi:catechol 2,3-dioxygenase
MAIAHIGHVDLRVSDIDASRRFFTDMLGLFVTEETPDRVYLRAWQDWDHHTLVLTRATESAIDHVAWRVTGPDDLAWHERDLKARGIEIEKVEGSVGHGASLRFKSAVSGIPLELYWEVDSYACADPGLTSQLPSHPQRFTGVGVAPRRFDHVNFLVDDVREEQEWFSGVLGVRHNYYAEDDQEIRLGSWLASTNLSHEVAFMRNSRQNGNRLHHVAYFLDSPDQLMRGATLLADAGIPIEWGPGQHGTSGAIFLYCFEPSGHRVEVWTGGMLLFAPDWRALRWGEANSRLALELWGSGMPETYLTYGTPIAEPLYA